MLRPEALMRLSALEHRFCPTPSCPVVYFGHEEVFDRGEIVVPVFQKEPAGERMVCYCFAISERDIRTELIRTGRSSASERIGALVKADRCACEVRNPQGSCCLGNVAAAVEAAKAPVESRGPVEHPAEVPPNAETVLRAEEDLARSWLALLVWGPPLKAQPASPRHLRDLRRAAPGAAAKARLEFRR